MGLVQVQKVAEEGVEWEYGMTANRYSGFLMGTVVSSWGDENVLKVHSFVNISLLSSGIGTAKS